MKTTLEKLKKYFPTLPLNAIAKIYRARCARWTYNATCRSLGMVSVNREDKIQFIKDGLTAFLGSNQVLGVVPKALANGDLVGKTIGEELQVPTMSDRLNAMFNHVDAFIALLGGLRTLEEIFHISSLA
ncbi:hypothetical protein D5086_014943 [Populus alba]|uniref:Uncharacterized protein n=1 Tax=Populus alba TaxID=43335 RepID=A0ACC4C0F9_POPAL